MPADARHFLFLQGVASPFFARLADHLSDRGQQVSRINFCGGDVLYWGRRRAWSFRDVAADLPDYLDGLQRTNGFTDVVLFGHRRPVHAAAIDLANRCRLRLHVFEEGYVRPNWLTLERGGVNGDSALPRDPDWYLAVDPGLPRHGIGEPVPTDIRVRAAHDMAYHLANAVNPLSFPGYRTHRPYNAAVEYAGWARRFGLLPLRARRDARAIRALFDADARYFVLPLQLNGDTQITLHSRYGGMPHLIDTVMRSFAADAPDDVRLVIKNHPLDTGLVDYANQIEVLAAELGLRDRVLYLESGHLPTLIRRAVGVVTVNSTAGLQALAYGCPTVALGCAIYDLPGLTFQGRFADFWHSPVAPDEHLFRAFRNTVIHTTQVNGDFYTAAGIRMAVANCGRLLAEPSPLQQLIARRPPQQPAADPMEALA